MFVTQVLPEAPESEIVDGIRVRKVSPKLAHATVQLNVGTILRRLAPPGKVGTEWRCSVEDGISELVPDISFVARDRLLSLSEDEREQPAFAPDVAVEVWSKGDKRDVLDRKIWLYLSHGCALVLDVRPPERIIDAYEEPGRARRFVIGERFESRTAPWLQFDVAEAFAGLGEL